MTILGDATVIQGNVLRLTPPQVSRVGGAYLTEKVSFSTWNVVNWGFQVSIVNFESTYTYKITARGPVGGVDPGADGIALVIQNHAVELGNSGEVTSDTLFLTNFKGKSPVMVVSQIQWPFIWILSKIMTILAIGAKNS